MIVFDSPLDIYAPRKHAALFCDKQPCSVCAGNGRPVEFSTTVRLVIRAEVPVPHDVAEKAVEALLEHLEVVCRSAAPATDTTTRWTFELRRGRTWVK